MDILEVAAPEFDDAALYECCAKDRYGSNSPVGGRRERTFDREFARRAFAVSTLHPKPDIRPDRNGLA